MFITFKPVRGVLTLFLLCLTSSVVGSTITPRDIPVEAFAALPSYSGVKVSPGGKRLAYFRPKDGRNNLIVQNAQGTEGFYVPPLDVAKENSKTPIDYSHFYWKSDDYLVLVTSMTLDRWVFKGKSHETRTISFHIPSKKFIWLGKPKSGTMEHPSQHETIVDLLPDEPHHILLGMDFSLKGKKTIYKVNLKNGRRSIAQRPRTGIQHWYADSNSEVRLGFGYTVRQSKKKAIYKDITGNWIDLTETDWLDRVEIAGFATDPNTLFVTGPNQFGLNGLYKLNVESGEITEEVFSSAHMQINDIFEHPDTGKVAGVTYTDDFSRIKYFDPDFALLQRSLEAALPGTIIKITDKAKDVEGYLILAFSDTDPGTYYYYNRPRRQLINLFPVRRQIDPRLMSPTRRVDIPVRDGTTIPGYLTLPQQSSTNLPVIILPHGGPHARDTAHWDYEAQFYTSRGYAVLKPNFRGSSGYGATFEKKGNLQWGGLMQDDLTDATKWLIEEGVADKNRICIVGSSYGGYAALMGAIKEPNLYKCAVSVNGVTDLPKLKASDKNVIGGRSWTKFMGLRGVEDTQVSPYHRAEELNTPTLLIAAKDDARVSYKQSRDLNKRLGKLGKESKYIELKTGTHYMVSAQARLKALQAIESFLTAHIGNTR